MTPEPFIELVLGDRYILRLVLTDHQQNGEPVYEMRMTPSELAQQQGWIDNCFPREPRKS